jgi:predicted GH43/DUF377 family glycosyl hydrolase
VNRPAALAVRHQSQRIEPDRSRVIARIFVPGRERFEHQDSRAAAVVARVLALGDSEVDSALEQVMAGFGTRHRDLVGTFKCHAGVLADRVEPGRELSDARWLLLGAAFTSEYSIEGAALFNPSMVAHPDQSGVPAGGVRFVMSVRSVGEGHRSSIGFRTGTIDGAGLPTLDPPSRFATSGTHHEVEHEAGTLRSELDRLDSHGESADFVLEALGERFTKAQLHARLLELQASRITRWHAERTIEEIRHITDRTYGVGFPSETSVSERVLWPSTRAERQGMEDARFVQFTDDDGASSYYATYTAYDGVHICQQLLETTDFRMFASSPLVGEAAANKGMALFPRRIGGRFAALSRCDRESNSVAFSDDLRQWSNAAPIQLPTRAWESLQLGNCGSPIETDAGWLVLTHGVGPMRTYSIGALLLDIDDPTIVLGCLRQPLLTPAPDERDGYVPNVVYSCGALLHGDTLVLPYGICDTAIGIATVPMPDLLAELERSRER